VTHAGVSKNRTRHELYQHIDAEYYGYKDDDNGALDAAEADVEEQGPKRDQSRLFSLSLTLSPLEFPFSCQRGDGGVEASADGPGTGP
jgi:hypothetical protein